MEEKPSEMSLTLSEAGLAAVTFDTETCYQIGSDIECHYTVSPYVKVSSWDWIGLYEVGWKSLRDHVCACSAKMPDKYVEGTEAEGKVVFKAYTLPKQQDVSYQFVYVAKQTGSIWPSEPFKFARVGQPDKMPSLMVQPPSLTELSTHEQQHLQEELRASFQRMELSELEVVHLKQEMDTLRKSLEVETHSKLELSKQLEALQQEKEKLGKKVYQEEMKVERATKTIKTLEVEKGYLQNSMREHGSMQLKSVEEKRRMDMRLARFAKRRMSAQTAQFVSEDGDFTALQQRRDDAIEEPVIQEEEPEEEKSGDGDKGQDTRRTTSITAGEWEDWRVGQLFEEADTATVEEFEELVKGVEKLHSRNPFNKMNILHHVLDIGRGDLGRVLLKYAPIRMLLQECDVNVAQIKGKKNILHYVTEIRDLELAEMIMGRLRFTEIVDLLTQETPVIVEGQRPRTLPPFHLAAYWGLKDFVSLYLDYGNPVSAVNSKKDTALLWAARWNHLDVIRFLLRHGADTELENDKGSTALYWAVRYGHAESVQVLLVEGHARVNIKRKMGLVNPVILACALGYLDIVKLLIEHKGDPNTFIRGGERPIHHAAKEGYSQVIEFLLDKGADIDAADDGGDTALLYAARYGHPRCLQVLLNRGANFDHKNHVGEDLMSLAVDSDDNQILKVALKFLRNLNASAAITHSPILLAAENGECEKIQTLLKLKLDARATDEEGNTMLHRAAMENQSEVIMRFSNKVKVDAMNSKGNTALHEACTRGFSASISALIQNKASGSIQNKHGETALHVAASCRDIQADTVKELMNYIIKSQAWESLNIKDKDGNNALHIAASIAKPEVMWEFRHVPMKVKDRNGSIALHRAVRRHEPEALSMMLDIYEAMKRDADINEQNNDLETVMHLVARLGFKEHIDRLVLFGADLALQDKDGNTVCHRLTQLSAEYPHKALIYLSVFEEIVLRAAMWWCMRHGLQYPHGDQKTYELYTRQALKLLLTETYNLSHNNVIALACRVGAADILLLILSKREVMCFQHGDKILYNVTNMTPLTNNPDHCCGFCGRSRDNVSYIEWLVANRNPEMAAKVLNVQPFKEIEAAYTMVAAWTFTIIIVLHIIYMILFSHIGFHFLAAKRGENEKAADWQNLVLFYVIPLEPALILLYNFYTLLKCNYANLFKVNRRDRNLCRNLRAFLRQAAPILVSFTYSLTVVSWVLLYHYRYARHNYCLSVAVWLGWMYTITFTRGFRAINYFWRLIQQMLVKDITRFITLYAFVLLAFSYAVHVIIGQSKMDLTETIFVLFNLMLGMGDLFVPTYVGHLLNEEVTYLKVIYVIYRILATILLLNLVIAMMNDSYSAILRQQAQNWRVDSVRLGCTIEKAAPIFTHMFSQIRFMKGGKEQQKDRYAAAAAAAAAEEAQKGGQPDLADLDAEEYEADVPAGLNQPDIWYIAVPRIRLNEEEHVEDDLKMQMLQEIRTRMTSMEDRICSDIQQLKIELQDMREMSSARRRTVWPSYKELAGRVKLKAVSAGNESSTFSSGSAK